MYQQGYIYKYYVFLWEGVLRIEPRTLCSTT
jgi:hypothetical protein